MDQFSFLNSSSPAERFRVFVPCGIVISKCVFCPVEVLSGMTVRRVVCIDSGVVLYLGAVYANLAHTLAVVDIKS